MEARPKNREQRHFKAIEKRRPKQQANVGKMREIFRAEGNGIGHPAKMNPISRK